MAKLTYKDAGVDLETYAEGISRLGRLMRRTQSPRVIPLENGFAGLFRLDFASGLFARNYEDPVLVSCTDGVGTKLLVAGLIGRHDTVGIDLVAMCVNDALCCGAEPLIFLDYVALPKDDPDRLEQIVSGISQGCIEGDCALLGGETAILPDLYKIGDYDLAGFCVGVVERRKIIDGTAMQAGDVVLGLPSSGLHSNGYSLARKAFFDAGGHKVDDYVEELGGTVGDVLLTPTRIYVRAVRKILRYYRVKQVVHAIAHITGGGLRENLERVVPQGKRVLLDKDSWPKPPVFGYLQKLGEVDDEEMERVFNMGIGMTLVVSPFYADSVRAQLAAVGTPSYVIGEVTDGERGVVWR